MSQRVTAKRVAAQQNNVDRKHNRADADSKPIWKPKRLPYVVRQNEKKKESKLEKVSLHILHDKRDRPFAPVALPRFAYRAGRRVGPERFVIGAAIIITGQP